MGRATVVENLEDRVFFSVGAAVLSGPLTTGFTYKFNQIADGTTGPEHTVTVLGPSTFNGHSAVK